MATQWIIFAKIVGPLVQQLSQDMFTWTCGVPADGDEPRLVKGDVQDPSASKKLDTFCEALESNAHRPPIVFFEKLIDPWTVGPLIQIYSWLWKRQAKLRFAKSDLWNILLIQPADWQRFAKRLLRVQRKVNRINTFEEPKLLISRLIDCSASWEKLVSTENTRRAVVLLSRTVGMSWSDEEVSNSGKELPNWYKS